MNDFKKQIYWVDYHARFSRLFRILIGSIIGFLWVHLLVNNFFISIGVSVIILLIGILKEQIYRPNMAHAMNLIHSHVKETEHSLPLFFKELLNIAEQLQRARILAQSPSLKLPFQTYYKGILPYFLVLIASVGLFFAVPIWTKLWTDDQSIKSLMRTDPKVVNKDLPPQYVRAHVTIDAPIYTQIKQDQTTDLNIQAILGSSITWSIKFDHDQELRVSLMNVSGEEIPLIKDHGAFVRKDRLTGSGIYYIKGYWKDSLIYQSEYYKMEVILDQSPKIEPKSKELYRFHLIGDPLHVSISAKISDDFLVKKAFIVATLARGSGENVKFREMKIPLHTKEFKAMDIHKQIDLKALNFSPGDELYYYWAAFDNRLPEPNFSKSDTYFLVFKDTAQIEKSELATLAVNIVPEYFRSQRQIIIDTEKLIAKQKKISAKQFGEISNEIGFDQKVLRLRYGQFLGEEFETSIGGGGYDPASTGSDDILEGFTHHSDGHGEGAMDVSHDAGAHQHAHHDHGSKEDKDPLAALMEQYIHAHDDSEINTFHEASTKSLLKMALEQMWNSELNLRLYKPQLALPYEMKALEYLKEAQHKARTFVKKSEYDPPPIKELDTRLTGEMKDVLRTHQVEKEWAIQQLSDLASRLLGYMEVTAITANQRKILQETTFAFRKKLSNEQRNENLTVFILLNKFADGAALTPVERQALKKFLTSFSERQLKAKDRHLGNGLLEQHFWKNVR